MDTDVLAQHLRHVADDIQQATDVSARCADTSAVVIDEDRVQYAIAAALRRLADQLES